MLAHSFKNDRQFPLTTSLPLDVQQPQKPLHKQEHMHKNAFYLLYRIDAPADLHAHSSVIINKS